MKLIMVADSQGSGCVAGEVMAPWSEMRLLQAGLVLQEGENTGPWCFCVDSSERVMSY